jgi:hypothetical protein
MPRRGRRNRLEAALALIIGSAASSSAPGSSPMSGRKKNRFAAYFRDAFAPAEEADWLGFTRIPASGWFETASPCGPRRCLRRRCRRAELLQGQGARHRVLLAAFLMQPHRPSRAERPEILDLHHQRRGDAREAVGERREQRAVTKIPHGVGRYAVDYLRHSPPSRTGVVPIFTTSFGPRTAAAGFICTICPVISQSNSMRTAASRCSTLGAASSRVPASRLGGSRNQFWPRGVSHQAARPGVPAAIRANLPRRPPWQSTSHPAKSVRSNA